jgi:hypothetical protein
MSTASANFNPRTVGYRRPILATGVAWAGVAALLPLGETVGATPTQTAAFGALLATVLLGALYRLDRNALEEHDVTVPDAWLYALLVPFTLVAWVTMVPMLMGGGQGIALPAVAGLLSGPPVSVVVYVWERGRRVDNR